MNRSLIRQTRDGRNLLRLYALFVAALVLIGLTCISTVGLETAQGSIAPTPTIVAPGFTPPNKPGPPQLPTFTAPPNADAGELKVDYQPSCSFLRCIFIPQVAYPPDAMCTFDPMNGSAVVEFQCRAGLEYTFLPQDVGMKTVIIRQPGTGVQSIQVFLGVPDTSSTGTNPPQSSKPEPPRPIPTQGEGIQPEPTEPASAPVGTSTPTSSSTGTQDPGNATTEYLKQCLKGTVAYSPPSSMEHGRRDEFVLRVALKGSPEEPGTGLPSGGPVVTAHPRLCALMRADLTGEAFDIERRGNASGLIALPSDEVGEWGWYITPREPGRHKLELRLFAPIPDTGGEFEVQTFEADIEVNVGFLYLVNEVVNKWSAPLGITIPVILAAAGAVYLRLRRNRYKPQHSADADQLP